MFSLKDRWLPPASGKGDARHRQVIWQPLGMIVVVIIILVVLSAFAWALIEFIREKIG